MLRKIYKYNVSNKVSMPAGAKILHCDFQNGGFFLWAEVDQSKQDETRIFHVLATGLDVPDGMIHQGTVFIREGEFVFHVYEKIKC